MEDVGVGERLPDSVFLDTPAFPSALQVFASVGGLALLAEHLPLLYPEVTRQVTPPAGAADHHSTQSNIGSDWVTVESSDFSFEVHQHNVLSQNPKLSSRHVLIYCGVPGPPCLSKMKLCHSILC